MRRVADVLGTGPASLYAHVANKDELLDLLLDRIAAEIEVPEPDPAHWQDQLRSVGRQSYEVFRRHRDIAVISLANIPTSQNALRVADRMLAIMLAGGVPPQVAAWALDRLSLYIAADSYEGSLYNKRRVSERTQRQRVHGEHMPTCVPSSSICPRTSSRISPSTSRT